MLTEVGKRMVMLDGTGHPAQVLETHPALLEEVDAAFAYGGGEGDQT